MSENQFSARFFDGQSLRSYQASVEICDTHLLIRVLINDEEKSFEWQWGKLQVMEPPHDNRDIVFGYRDTPGARLVINERKYYNDIHKHILPSHIKHASVNHPWHKVMVIVIACSVLLIILLFAIPIAAPFIAKVVPQSWDDKLGQFVIKGFSESKRECIAPAGKAALEKMVAKLGKGSDKKFDVKVLKTSSDDINAFAVPGDHIIIFSGLLQFADSPDEVAGVLAHEMGHAIEHHPTQGLIRTMGINIVVASSFGTSVDYLTQLFHLKFSREDEAKADDIALLLLQQANIDKKGFADFFEKFSKEHDFLTEHEKVLEYFSSHPGMAQRMEHVKAQPAQPKTVPSLSSQEWRDLKDICAKTDKLKFSP